MPRKQKRGGSSSSRRSITSTAYSARSTRRRHIPVVTLPRKSTRQSRVVRAFPLSATAPLRTPPLNQRPVRRAYGATISKAAPASYESSSTWQRHAIRTRLFKDAPEALPKSCARRKNDRRNAIIRSGYGGKNGYTQLRRTTCSAK